VETREVSGVIKVVAVILLLFVIVSLVGGLVIVVLKVTGMVLL